jgi:hypothetical protein
LDWGSPHFRRTVALVAPSATTWVPQRREAAWLRVGKESSDTAKVIISERIETSSRNVSAIPPCEPCLKRLYSKVSAAQLDGKGIVLATPEVGCGGRGKWTTPCTRGMSRDSNTI